VIRNDNSDYHDRGDNSIKRVLHPASYDEV
jgi:hypothetical protein